MCYEYLLEDLISDIASNTTVKQDKKSMYYTPRVIHDTPNTHNIELTPMLSLYFYSILGEYSIY